MASLIIILGLIVAAQSILIALLWTNVRNLENEDQLLHFRINNAHNLIRIIETQIANRNIPIRDRD
jgi:hypothetical protein